MQTDQIAEKIAFERQRRKMTQEELALRLGVTAQAISRWERGQGLPDVAIIADICSVLELDANDLFGIETHKTGGRRIDGEAMLLAECCAEPLVVAFGAELVPAFAEGLKGYHIYEKRKQAAREKGYFFPLIRFYDMADFAPNEYAVYFYGKREFGGVIENMGYAFYDIAEELFGIGGEAYSRLINKQIVRRIVEVCEADYPGIAAGVYPEKISYLELELVLKEILCRGGGVKNYLRILEETERQMILLGNRDYAAVAEAIMERGIA